MSNQPERRRRFVRATAPAFGLLAAGLLVWQGSYAAFSATTQNNNDTFSSGSLTLTNDGNGGGVFAATTTATFGGVNLKPGNTGTVCINVKNTGTSVGSLGFYRSALTDTNVGNPASLLSTQLNMTIDEAVVAAPVTCATYPGGPTNVVTNVALSALPTTYAGALSPINIPAAGFVAYRIVWTFNAAAGNTFQSASSVAGFTWEEQ